VSDDNACDLEVSLLFGHVRIAASDGSMPNLMLSPAAAIELAAKLRRLAHRAMKRQK
jgi:hypothetical protein